MAACSCGTARCRSGRTCTAAPTSPRSVFEAPAFEYTSLENVPIVVEGAGQLHRRGARRRRARLLVGPTMSTERRLAPGRVDGASLHLRDSGAARAKPSSTTTSSRQWSGASAAPSGRRRAPAAAHRSSISSADDHLGDLDVHGDLLDVFDVGAADSPPAWHEPVRRRRAVGAAGVTRCAHAAAAVLLPPVAADGGDRRANQTRRARVSPFVTARRWPFHANGAARITDLAFSGGSGRRR